MLEDVEIRRIEILPLHSVSRSRNTIFTANCVYFSNLKVFSVIINEKYPIFWWVIKILHYTQDHFGGQIQTGTSYSKMKENFFKTTMNVERGNFLSFEWNRKLEK